MILALANFFVPGVPVAQGSMRYLGKGIPLQHGPKVKPWRSAVASKAFDEWASPPTKNPIQMSLTFDFARPKSHYRTGRHSHLIKDAAPKRHTNYPDIDKLCRAVLDALAGVVYLDDSQVFLLKAKKLWVKDAPGLTVCVREMPDE